MRNKLELILDIKALAAEGPFWDTEKQCLYWVDILNKNVNIYSPKKNENRIIKLDQFVGTAIPREKGGLIVALQKGLYFINEDSGETQFIVDAESDIPDTRFNDGKCDSAGRLWVGTMDVNENQAIGSLYCLDTNLGFYKKIDGVTVSNGTAWSLDNRVMYYIDSPTKEVAAYDFDPEKAEIQKKRRIISFPDGEGVPDGMTIDSEGMLWIAHFDGSKVSRWDPNTGNMLEYISLPVEKVTSCCFGGEYLDELYITTARVGLSDEQLKEQPLAGGIFKYKTGVKGIKSYKYKG